MKLDQSKVQSNLFFELCTNINIIFPLEKTPVHHPIPIAPPPVRTNNITNTTTQKSIIKCAKCLKGIVSKHCTSKKVKLCAKCCNNEQTVCKVKTHNKNKV